MLKWRTPVEQPKELFWLNWSPKAYPKRRNLNLRGKQGRKGPPGLGLDSRAYDGTPHTKTGGLWAGGQRAKGRANCHLPLRQTMQQPIMSCVATHTPRLQQGLAAHVHAHTHSRIPTHLFPRCTHSHTDPAVGLAPHSDECTCRDLPASQTHSSSEAQNTDVHFAFFRVLTHTPWSLLCH